MLLYDFVFILNYELGNLFVLFVVLWYNLGVEMNLLVLLVVIKCDIVLLEVINWYLVLLFIFSEVVVESVDLCVLVCLVGWKCVVMVEMGL